MNREIVFKLFLWLLVVLFTVSLSSQDIDSLTQLEELLEFGIESEVVSRIKEMPNNPPDNILKMIISRYEQGSSTIKRAILDYFAGMDKPPQHIIDLVYNAANSEIIDRTYRVAVFNTLGKIGSVREGQFLLEKLNDFDTVVSNTAADALSRIKDPLLAEHILERLKQSDTDPEKYLIPDVAGKLVISLGEMKAEIAVDYLRSILRDKTRDKFLLGFTSVSLAKIGNEDSIEDIASNIEHPEIIVQNYSCNALSLFISPKVVPFLEQMLRSSNENSRIYGCIGLMNNKSLASIKIITYKFANDPSVKVKTQALESLLSFGQPGVTVVKERIKEKDLNDNTVYQISNAVAKNPNPESVAYLTEIYNRVDKKKKEIISKSVVRSSSSFIDPFIRILFGSEDYLIRIGAIRAVTMIKDTTLWDDLVKISESDPVEIVRKNAKNILSYRKL